MEDESWGVLVDAEGEEQEVFFASKACLELIYSGFIGEDFHLGCP